MMNTLIFVEQVIDCLNEVHSTLKHTAHVRIDSSTMKLVRIIIRLHSSSLTTNLKKRRAQIGHTFVSLRSRHFEMIS